MKPNDVASTIPQPAGAGERSGILQRPLNHQLANVLNNISDGVIAYNSIGQLSYANAAAAR